MSEQCWKSETPLGVAVIGAGGQEWARVFNALGVLRAATGPDALAEALADPRVAGLAVAGPVRERGEIVRSALAAGKHVLAQAPLTLDDAEAAALTDAAKAKGLLLMAGHPVLGHPAVVRLRDMVAAGTLGRVSGVYASNLGGDDASGDAWSDVLRDIAMILAVAGQTPQAVLTMGDDQTGVIHLIFPDQRQAHLFVSRQHPFGEQKLVVVGERQTAFFDDVPPLGGELVLYPRPVAGNGRTPAQAQGQRVDLPQGDPLAAQCRQFLDAMASGRLPAGDDGLPALRVWRAAWKSLKEGGVRVSLATSPAPDYFAHPTAVIDAGVAIGAGSKIWHFSHVLKGSRLGERCNLGQNVVVGPDVSIGSGCKIQNNVSVYQGVTLEDDVFCGPSMVFTNIFNPRAHVPRMHEVRRTLVKHGAALGANCTIVCGNAIGRYAFVGAGAVVTRDVPDHAVMVGNPARRIGWMCVCGEKLDETLRCAVCGAAYAEGETGLRPL